MKHLHRYGILGPEGVKLAEGVYFVEDERIFFLHDHPTLLRGLRASTAPAGLCARYPSSWFLASTHSRRLSDRGIEKLLVSCMRISARSWHQDADYRIVPVPGCPRWREIS